MIIPDLSFDVYIHITNVTRMAFLHLRNVAKLKNALSPQDAY